MLVLQPQFGAALSSFKYGDGGLTAARIQTITKVIYPALNNTGLCGAVTQFVLSSLIFHQGEVEHWPVEHQLQMNCHLFRLADLLTGMTPAVHVQYPWDQGGAVDDPPPIVGTGAYLHTLQYFKSFAQWERL
jgi:hypothetical protein